MKRLFALLICFLLLAPASAWSDTPRQAMQHFVDDVLLILEKQPSPDDASAQEAFRAKLRKKAYEIFDFIELSKRTLAKGWNQLTIEQRKEFVDLYASLLERTYSDRITAYSKQEIVLTGSRMLGKTKAEVKSMIVSPDKEIPIDYRLILKKGHWRIYDVKVEGIGLINNYRSQFKDILKREGPAGMLEVLRNKLEVPAASN